MSSIVTVFDPSTSNTTQFTAPNSAANGALVFFNESNISIDLTFADKSEMYLPAWYHRHKCGATGSVNVTWDVHQVLSSDNPPMSEVIVEAFAQGEAFPADGPLVRQANGNVTSSGGGVATSITNTGNTPGTSIISVIPSDAGANTWTADNSGNLAISGDNGGTLTTLLQLIAGASPAVKLAAAAVLTTIQGNGRINGNLNVVGTTTLDNGQIATNGVGGMSINGISTPGSGFNQVLSATTGNAIISEINGVQVFGVFGNGPDVMAGSLTTPSITGNASGTVLNGGSSGTATLIQDFIGTIKRVKIFLNGFRTGGTNQSITLPTAFTSMAQITTGNIGTSSNSTGFSLMSAGSAQSITYYSNVTTSTGGSSVQETVLYGIMLASIEHAFDTIQFNASWSNGHTGVITIEGQ